MTFPHYMTGLMKARGGLCPEYLPVYNAMLTKPTGLDMTTQDYIAKNLVSKNLWSILDIVRFYGSHTNSGGEAVLDWKWPSGGPSLMQAGKGTFDTGTESWIKQGNNTIVNDAGSLKLTYIDNLEGALDYLRAASDLTTNLTVGKYYKIRLRAKVDSGMSVQVRLLTATTYAVITQTDFTWFEFSFMATNATTMYMRFYYPGYVNGQRLWLDEWSIKEWTGMKLYNAPVHTPRQGILFNGTTQYGNNNWVPSVSGVNFTQNSASQILYIRNNVDVDAGHGVLGSTDLKNCAIIPRSGTTLRSNCNDSDNLNGTVTDSRGMYVNTRTAANVKTIYRNGINIGGNVAASTGIPTRSPYTGAFNDDNVAVGFRADQVFFEAWGAGLTQTQVNDLTDVVNGAATLLGVNVF
jgi:hypothetical protein